MLTEVMPPLLERPNQPLKLPDSVVNLKLFAPKPLLYCCIELYRRAGLANKGFPGSCNVLPQVQIFTDRGRVMMVEPIRCRDKSTHW